MFPFFADRLLKVNYRKNRNIMSWKIVGRAFLFNMFLRHVIYYSCKLDVSAMFEDILFSKLKSLSGVPWVWSNCTHAVGWVVYWV